MNYADHLMLVDEVSDLVKRRRAWIYREARAGTFPPSDRGRWSFVEVQAWIAWRRCCTNAGRDVGTWRDHLVKAA